MRNTVKINGYDFDALIDTGSTITLIRESVYQILGRPTINPTKIKLTSFGNSEIKTFGSFKSTIDIEDNKFMTDIYVINNSQTTIDVIIGTDVLKQTEFKISANDKSHKLEESNLEKVDKLVKLEKKYEILQEILKIAEQRLVEKEIECASLTEKILIVNALTESNDHPKTSMSTEEREINPSKRKAKKSKSSGRNANKTSHSDENQALAKEKNVLLRQIDFLNSIILDTKLKEPNKSKAHFVKKRKQHIYKKDEPVTIKRTQFRTRLKLRPNFYGTLPNKDRQTPDRYEVEKVGQHEGPHLTSTAVDFMKMWSTAYA
ncbi:hypothetical protein TNCV_3066621 [Trichonephila clavipes]|nr:hypothetical protein TNCV_3066621 [Trichonephila clavipes]